MAEHKNAVYAARRAKLAQMLGDGGVAVLPTAPEQPRNRDSGFPFRHDSYFYYLTGFTEPNAWLVITAEGRSTLLCQPKDLEREIWDGYRLGPEAAPAALGVDEAHSVSELNALMPKLLENRASVWFPFATHGGLAAQVEGWLGQVRARVRMGAQCPDAQQDLCALLDEMRLIKDASELATMRRAAQISAGAHVRAMQASARMLRAGDDARPVREPAGDRRVPRPGRGHLGDPGRRRRRGLRERARLLRHPLLPAAGRRPDAVIGGAGTLLRPAPGSIEQGACGHGRVE